jgi:hypothetical protein
MLYVVALILSYDFESLRFQVKPYNTEAGIHPQSIGTIFYHSSPDHTGR